jgi:recombination DNA repair RAD52 pathway protein
MKVINDSIGQMLAEPLDAKLVKPAPTGKHGEYISGFDVIDAMNRIFGWDGWGYDLNAMNQTFNGPGPKEGQYLVGYLAIVKVWVFSERGLITRQATGSGDGINNSITIAMESASKEAETDALKRACRTLGYPLGLALYDKAKANIAVALDPKMVKKACKDLTECMTLDALKELYSGMYKVGYGENTKIVQAKDDRKAVLLEELAEKKVAEAAAAAAKAPPAEADEGDGPSGDCPW